MQRRAYHVWRWVERMNRPQALLDGYPSEALIAEDGVPDTLAALLRFVAEDFLPELAAHVAFANDWLAARPDLAAGTNGLDSPGARVLGKAGFAWRGHMIETMVMPYRFWLLQRLQAALATEGRALLDETGLGALATLATTRPVERAGNLEVWGAPR